MQTASDEFASASGEGPQVGRAFCNLARADGDNEDEQHNEKLLLLLLWLWLLPLRDRERERERGSIYEEEVIHRLA